MEGMAKNAQRICSDINAKNNIVRKEVLEMLMDETKLEVDYWPKIAAMKTSKPLSD